MGNFADMSEAQSIATVADGTSAVTTEVVVVDSALITRGVA